MNIYDSFSGMEYLKDYLKVKNQLHILYSQSLITFLFPVLAALSLTIVLVDIANNHLLFSWLGTVIAYSIFRYVLIWKYNNTDITPENAMQWLSIFSITVFISGILWGTAGVFLVPYENSYNVEFTIYNGLTVLIICGLVAGAIISYSVNISVVLCYSFPALVPPAFYLISLGDNFNSAFGGFILLYYFFIGVAAYRMNSQFMYYIDMEYEQEKLKHKYNDLVHMYTDLNKNAHAEYYPNIIS